MLEGTPRFESFLEQEVATNAVECLREFRRRHQSEDGRPCIVVGHV